MPVFYPAFEEDNRCAFPRSRQSPAHNPGPYNWSPQNSSFNSYPRRSVPLHEAPDYHHTPYNHPHYYSPPSPFLQPPPGAVAYPPDYYTNCREGFQNPPPPYLYYSPNGLYYFPDWDHNRSAELPRWLDSYGHVGPYHESPAGVPPPFSPFKLVPASDILAGRRSLPAPAPVDEDSSLHVQPGYPSQWVKPGPDISVPLSSGSAVSPRFSGWIQPQMIFPDQEYGRSQQAKRNDAFKHDRALPVVWHAGQPFAMVPVQELAGNCRKPEERTQSWPMQSGVPFKLIPFVNEDGEDDAEPENKPRNTRSDYASDASEKESSDMNGHFPILWKGGLPFIVMPSNKSRDDEDSRQVRQEMNSSKETPASNGITPYILMPANSGKKKDETYNSSSQGNFMTGPTRQDKTLAETKGSSGTFPILWKGEVPYLVIPAQQLRSNQEDFDANKKENDFSFPKGTESAKCPEKVIPVVQNKPNDHNLHVKVEDVNLKKNNEETKQSQMAGSDHVKLHDPLREAVVSQKPAIHVKVEDSNSKKDNQEAKQSQMAGSDHVKVYHPLREAAESQKPAIHVKVEDSNSKKDNQETKQSPKAGNGQKKSENGKKSMPPIMLKVDGGSSHKKSGNNAVSPRKVEENLSEKKPIISNGASTKAASSSQMSETKELQTSTETKPLHSQSNSEDKYDNATGKKISSDHKHTTHCKDYLMESPQEKQDTAEVKSNNYVSFTRDSAAVRIQSSYKGHLVRRTEPLRQLKMINNAKTKGKDIFDAFVTNPMRRDPLEKRKASESIMGLLLQLDSIQGAIPYVRECRKTVARELSMLSEQIDCIDQLCLDDPTVDLRSCEDTEKKEQPNAADDNPLDSEIRETVVVDSNDKQDTNSCIHVVQDECKQDSESIPTNPANYDGSMRDSSNQGHEYNQYTEAVSKQSDKQDINIKLDACEVTPKVANVEDQECDNQHSDTVSKESDKQDINMKLDVCELTPKVAKVEDQECDNQHSEVVPNEQDKPYDDIRDATEFTLQDGAVSDEKYKQDRDVTDASDSSSHRQSDKQDRNLDACELAPKVANVEDQEYDIRDAPEFTLQDGCVSNEKQKQDSVVTDASDSSSQQQSDKQDRNLDACELAPKIADEEDQENDIRDAPEFTLQDGCVSNEKQKQDGVVTDASDSSSQQKPEAISDEHYKQDGYVTNVSDYSDSSSVMNFEDHEYKQQAEAISENYNQHGETTNASDSSSQVVNVEDNEYKQPDEAGWNENCKQDSDFTEVCRSSSQVVNVEDHECHKQDIDITDASDSSSPVLNDEENKYKQQPEAVYSKDCKQYNDVSDMKDDSDHMDVEQLRKGQPEIPTLEASNKIYCNKNASHAEHLVEAVENGNGDVGVSAISVSVPSHSNENNDETPNFVTSVKEAQSGNIHHVKYDEAYAPDFKSCEVTGGIVCTAQSHAMKQSPGKEKEKQIEKTQIHTESKEEENCLKDTGEQIGEKTDEYASNQEPEALQNLCAENSSLKELIGKLTEVNDQQANAILQLTERMKRLEQSYNKKNALADEVDGDLL